MHTFRSMQITFTAFCVMLLAGSTLLAAEESRATVNAADILRPDVLRGPNHLVHETVVIKHNRYVFRLETRWGDITADGLNMLGMRLQELRAIERAERLSRSPQFVGGLVESIAQTPRGVGTLLSNPVGAVLGVPEGVKRFAATKVHPEDRRAGSVTRRSIAHEVGCDPETTNPILQPMLDNLATRKGLGKLAGKVGMSAAVPGLGLVPLTAEMQTNLLVKLPHELNRELSRELKQMRVDSETISLFLTSPHFTTGQRLIFVSQLRKLKHVSNRAALVKSAASAESEADALAANDQLRMLVDLDRRHAIVRIDDVGVPCAVLDGETCMLIWSADCLLATDDVDSVVSRFRKQHPDSPAVIFCSGTVPPATQRRFSAAGMSTSPRR